MGTRGWIGSWPVYRQLTGTDRLGPGAAAKRPDATAAIRAAAKATTAE